MYDRKKTWATIWEKKYSTQIDNIETLHVNAGYDGLNYDQWKKLTKFFIELLDVNYTHNILEVGCGCGAFLKQIPDAKSYSGTDLSESAIIQIKGIIEGNFITSEASVIPFADASFERILSFGVFFYFPDLTYATMALDEMVRTLKPNGKILIGEVNDIDKKDIALKEREKTEEKRKKHRIAKVFTDHIYYSKDFFIKYAKNKNLKISIIEEDREELDFYYNSKYRFSILFEKK